MSGADADVERSGFYVDPQDFAVPQKTFQPLHKICITPLNAADVLVVS